MAFSQETKIFTDRGWKPVGDIGGRDRLLVRNFIGDAEFLQPFAIRKRTYTGPIVKFGGKYWSVSVTPEHKVVYEKGTIEAQDVMVNPKKYLYRKFKYTREDRPDEKLTLKNGDTTRVVMLSDEDWYTIVAYTITKGFISKDANPRLKFFLEMSNVLPIISILDKLGISWSSVVNDQTVVVTVNRDNNLARKLKRFLNGRARRDMYLPDKMVYGSSQTLMKHFLGTITSLVAKPSQTRPNQLVFSSSNQKLLRTLKDMCMFVGYGFSMTESAGVWVAYIIPSQISPWAVRFIQKETYSGYIYEIDLFDGLVYVTEKSLPVWMSPK